MFSGRPARLRRGTAILAVDGSAAKRRRFVSGRRGEATLTGKDARATPESFSYSFSGPGSFSFSFS
ncbi:hypothetical protein OPIT5_02840 [Opitutaceae bacterium TAV5]|nr:hypothetical protein OPIT5_02840 [Opitutaceae bacterium TAV5]